MYKACTVCTRDGKHIHTIKIHPPLCIKTGEESIQFGLSQISAKVWMKTHDTTNIYTCETVRPIFGYRLAKLGNF